jgi:diaminopimelate epimerase
MYPNGLLMPLLKSANSKNEKQYGFTATPHLLCVSVGNRHQIQFVAQSSKRLGKTERENISQSGV